MFWGRAAMAERLRAAEQRATQAEAAVTILTDVVDRLTRSQSQPVPDGPGLVDEPLPPVVARAIHDQRLQPAESRRLLRWAREHLKAEQDPLVVAEHIRTGIAP